MMEKVLITGAGGFIGRAVTELAVREQGWDVYRLVSGRPPPRIHSQKHPHCDSRSSGYKSM